MGYSCVVLVKQVPDTKRITGQAMNDDGTVNRAALPTIFNPEDLYALEMALDIRDRFGGTVAVVTMGPPAACEVLRESFYRGADRCVLITDRKAAASDTLATSYILSCAVRKIGRSDVVLCGRQAIDGDTAQVGPQLAEKLGIPQITCVQELHVLNGQTIRVTRNIGNGFELVECRLPVLLTVLDGAPMPRPSAGRRMMKYKKARARVEVEMDLAARMPDADQATRSAQVQTQMAVLAEKNLQIEQWTLADIGADLTWCGREGSPTKVHRIQSIVLTGKGHKSVQATDEAVAGMVEELITDHTIG
ncbi:MAG: electron transfer flavoprotein subunit beta/FixA family protein [Planctomycetes bacterium]|nr:electron transfer flavoprotein subunit beta/FixA family protein [Planctomycetota bacterium]